MRLPWRNRRHRRDVRGWNIWTILLLLGSVILSPGAASAAGVTTQVVDGDGQPLPFAVVTLTLPGDAPIPVATPPALKDTYIDQRDETFIPYVVAIIKGGEVTFRNSDITRHHVYTFSPIHPFEFILKPGDISPPQYFNATGVAAIGCNIHDQMIAYVYVSGTPLTAVADNHGRVAFANVPPGNYQLHAWYPQLKPGAKAPSQQVTIGADPVNLSISVPAIPYVSDSMDGMDGMN